MSENTHMPKAASTVGAVLVQGGGIAGVQAALDLSAAGFKVYLVERSPAIGGMMARLDKTFPTGDCATCIVSPKLVECARDMNVEILTLSDIEGIEGGPGNFRVKVRSFPRYINEDICTGCGDCVEVCPVSIPSDFERGLGSRRAIAKQSAQAVPNMVDIVKNGHAPCKVSCPANINVQGYVQLIKKKEYLKAVELIRERNPLSAICGRVCTHPCEAECTRAAVDDPVAIRLLKRFASDREMEMLDAGDITLPEQRTPEPGAKRIAIIGAGPAGLTAADDLAERGFAVTVYEEAEKAGGMLRYGIPEYRLPKRILDHEIELIRRKGVTFNHGVRVGRDTTFDDIRRSSDAVFLAVGAPDSRRLGIQGEDLPGVLSGLSFLRAAADPGNRPAIRGRTLVIGGGNVAVDAARTALRCGADSVEMIALESRAGMPAYPEEIAATLDEGIEIRNGWGPKRILGGATVEGIELRRCVRVFGNDGRFAPEYDDTDTARIDADTVIVAIGQAVNRELLESLGIDAGPSGLMLDAVTLETPVDGLFAGGDIATGPASVIDAVAAGKRAAESIARYCAGEDLTTDRFESTVKPVPEDLLPSTKGVAERRRSVPAELAVDARKGAFDEVECGLSEEDALAECERCLNCAMCSECMECVSACEQLAVNHSQTGEIRELSVGAVILAPGFEEFGAAAKGEFGFGRYANVMTSVQFERMLSAAGPFEGHVVRLSDKRPAKRIAFIQCVGSRDTQCGHDFCSSICCMASTKQAMVAMEHGEGIEAAVFNMDIRAHGKDFDQYFERAKNEKGVRYIKSMPSRVIQVPGTKDIRLRYNDGRGTHEEDFDLLVLAVGMETPSHLAELAGRIGIGLDAHGFCATKETAPLSTSRPGVFVAGSFQEPKDIPETVTQASGAASMAMELLASARGSHVTRKRYPEERDITDEQPRIGVFVCHCGMNIGSVVDVAHVAAQAARLPGVVMATHTMYTCADSSLMNIREAIREHRLNRIVVASCTPRTHEALFRESMKEAGLNPYLFELANIRDQCSWVHAGHPRTATEKAIDLVGMAVARSRRLIPLRSGSVPVKQTGLVIGGGLSGMTAALALADQGFPVRIVERSERLGGRLNTLRFTLGMPDIGAFRDELISRVSTHPRITVHTGAAIEAVSGHIGSFATRINSAGGTAQIESGAIIVATGAEPVTTESHRYGTSDAVVTHGELENMLAEDRFPRDAGNVVMIQCVDSRSDYRPYCSRVCCSMAVKNALRIKENDPETNVFVLYRDMRTYGFREDYFKEARGRGVIFIRYEAENPPEVSDENGALVVTVDSPDFPETIEIESGLVSLGTGMAPPPENGRLADMLKVPLNADGFFVEAHMKLRPVDFATEGIFLCGLAHSPKFIPENIAQARAAAARTATVLSKESLDVGAQVSRVDQDRCISCMTCVNSCPYTAPFMNQDHKAEIEAAKCMGCGICASECPACAISLMHFETTQFDAMIEDLFAGRAAVRPETD